MKENKDQKYIIRCDRAGVFYANVTSREGSEAVLANARRIYSCATSMEGPGRLEGRSG